MSRLYSISQNRQYKDVYSKIMNNQHHTCIPEANYFLRIYNVQLKLALSAVNFFFLIDPFFFIVHKNLKKKPNYHPQFRDA